MNDADRSTGEVSSRWLDEHTILRELETLNDLSMAEARAYYDLARVAAEAEARHKTLRAQHILRAKALGTKAISEAEHQADSHPDVAEALMARLVSTAQAEACRESLRSIRNNQDGLRTAVASHRDMIAGPGMGGGRGGTQR